MKRRQEELSDIVQADPAVNSIAMFIGGGGTALNSGRMYISLKQREAREVNAQEIIARLRPKLDKVEDARLYMQASQDLRMGGRATRTQFEYTLQDANLAELNEWAPKILARMRELPQLRDVATDQQTEGTTLQLTIDRDTASRYGIQPQLIDDTLYDAFGQRQVTQYFTQLNSYHMILEIPPELQGRLDTLDKIYIRSPTTGEQVPLSCSVNGRACRCARWRLLIKASFRRSRSASTSPKAWRSARRPMPSSARRPMRAPATLSSSFRVPRRRSSSRSAACRS